MPGYTIVVRNRFSRTIYSITETNSVVQVFQAQEKYKGKFWIKIEIERWD